MLNYNAAFKSFESPQKDNLFSQFASVEPLVQRPHKRSAFSVFKREEEKNFISIGALGETSRQKMRSSFKANDTNFTNAMWGQEKDTGFDSALTSSFLP